VVEVVDEPPETLDPYMLLKLDMEPEEVEVDDVPVVVAGVVLSDETRK
jgi:hypothetical protein